jgi:uncharacterized membrane protein
MFCSSCGQALSQDLSYCNRCGAELKGGETLVLQKKPAGLAFVLSFGFLLTVGLTLGGIALVILLATKLLREGFAQHNATALAVSGLLLVLASVGIVGRQLSRLVSAYLEKEAVIEKKKERPSFLPPVSQLGAAQDYIPSVTEQTTRTFEPSFREKSR